MFQRLNHRLAHYALLIAAMALLTLPNLGNHSLWDVDEGVNAEAAREMLEAGNWITPSFNFEIRTAKPALLYWVQATSFSIFGVNEFAARLPSVLAGFLTVLLTYELGRRMFGSIAGLLSGLVLASAIEFCMLAHAATPDATLLLFTVATFYFGWLGLENGQLWWFVPAGVAAGLAVLTKGPIGVGLPGLVLLTYLAWNRQLSIIWDRRVLAAIGVFLLVALPWYILVALETRGVWAAHFLGRHNVHRFFNPMENHRGPLLYHALGLIVLFAPWSVLLGVALWYGVRGARRRSTDVQVESTRRETRIHRLLICWFGCYLIFFSVAATKLPNYVLPLYPALALLTAHFLDSWRRGEIVPPKWVMVLSTIGLAMVGVVTAAGLLIAGGAIPVPIGKLRILDGLDDWAILGVIPVVGAAVAWFYFRQGNRAAYVTAFAAACVLYMAGMAAFPSLSIDEHKAPRALVEQAGACRPTEEVRLAGLYYFQPTLVFYGQRQVKKLESLEQTRDFLSLPYRCFLFVPEKWWEKLQRHIPGPHREVA